MVNLKSLLLFAPLAVVGALPWQATPFNPASIPLAVRSPYLSAWLAQGSGAALNDVWPSFWNGQTLGWAGFVKVDGKAYSFLGSPTGSNFTKATQKSFSFTSTQSTFVLSAGPVDLKVEFLSPVEPKDLLRQSIPFSYLTVSASSTDKAAHSVQVYTDISAEWVSGDDNLAVNWNTTSSGNIITHQVQLAQQAPFSEINDHIQQGSAFYSTSSGSATTYQTGSDSDVRAQFVNDGKLANSKDTKFRAIKDAWPVFAFAHDLKSVNRESAPVIFTIGHIRDPAIKYIIDGGALQDRHSYFWSRLSTPTDVVRFFTNDYRNAVSKAKQFDAKVHQDASKISEDYASVVALSIRQSLASTEITISKKSNGNWNTSDIIMFMKEISSDGNVNTVDVIFPAWPILLYTNPALGKYLLEGIFRYQASGQYPNKWSVHDIGGSYPNAIGHNDGRDEAMPVEESGNQIIMALSYAQKTGDYEHLKKYSALLDQFTQFLITDSLIPANQISTDDFAGPLANQTNLAIKGIIGIRAMGEIEKILGNTQKSKNYTAIATDYVGKWQKLAASATEDHLTLSYGENSSWGLTYNLFADKLLKFNLFPKTIYETQTAWYKKVAQQYGVPLDTRHTYTKTDWEIWTAGIVTDVSLRDLLITSVKNFASDGLSSQPFGDWYETTDGTPSWFRARPVVGGHLALLIL